MPDQHSPLHADRATPHLTSDNLDEVLASIWSTLEDAVDAGKHAMHTVVVASVRNGGAEARVVVLRGADAAAGALRFHTDARSDKVGDIGVAGAVTVLGYDAEAKLQIRMSGTARVHAGDDVARAAWDASRWFSLHCYHQIEAPGAVVTAPPQAVRPANGTERHHGFENFAVVEIILRHIDWLYLAAAGHRRAQFTRRDDGGWTGQWVAP